MALRHKLMKKTPEPTYSINALAGLTGYDRRTLGTILGPDKGPWTIRQLCAGLRAFYSGGTESQREKRARLQSDLLSLELLERTEQLVPWKISWWLIRTVLTNARQQLLHVADKVGHDLRDSAIGERIDREVRAALSSAAKGEYLYPPEGTPKSFMPEFNRFLEKLASEDPAFQTWDAISDRIHDETKTKFKLQFDESETEDGGAPAGESQEDAGEADAEPKGESPAPRHNTGGDAPAGGPPDAGGGIADGI